MTMDQHAWPDKTTPLQSAWSMALSDLFICLFMYYVQIVRFAFLFVRNAIWSINN